MDRQQHRLSAGRDLDHFSSRVYAVESGHGNIEQSNIGAKSFGLVKGIITTYTLGYHGKALAAKQRPKALSENGMIVGYKNSDRHQVPGGRDFPNA